MTNKQFYVETKSGEVHLVELSEGYGCVKVSFGGRCYDLDPETAYDIADILLLFTNNIETYEGEY